MSKGGLLKRGSPNGSQYLEGGQPNFCRDAGQPGTSCSSQEVEPVENRDYYVYPLRIDNESQARELLRNLGVTKDGVEIMAPKSRYFAFRVGPLSTQAAQILKQELLSKGGEAALHGDVLMGRLNTDALLLGTPAQFKALLPKLKRQPFCLERLGLRLEEAIRNTAADTPKVLRCRDKQLQLGERTLVMGVLNITPDSFSDGGKYLEPNLAVERALEIESQGADILDIGAESTRPGGEKISAGEELSRLLPVLKGIARQVKIPVSIDTYKGATARAVLELGVDIINDVSGLEDPDMAGVIKDFDVPVVIMHNLRQPVDDVTKEVVTALGKKKKEAIEKGIREENIILDPGIGAGTELFGKDVCESLEVINRLDSLKCLGSPILVGVSRKSFIGEVLRVPPGERFEGTCAAVAVSVLRGADIVRVHDVKEMVRVVRMTDAILGRGMLKNG